MTGVIARVIRLGFAYVAAVLVATLVTLAQVLAWTVVTQTGPFARSMSTNLSDLVQAAILVTAVTALPGWLIAVGLAEHFSDRRPAFYMVTGMMTALFAHALLIYSSRTSSTLGEAGQIGWLIAASVIGGLAGGLAHWRLAGRNAGAWRG